MLNASRKLKLFLLNEIYSRISCITRVLTSNLLDHAIICDITINEQIRKYN